MAGTYYDAYESSGSYYYDSNGSSSGWSYGAEEARRQEAARIATQNYFAKRANEASAEVKDRLKNASGAEAKVYTDALEAIKDLNPNNPEDARKIEQKMAEACQKGTATKEISEFWSQGGYFEGNWWQDEKKREAAFQTLLRETQLNQGISYLDMYDAYSGGALQGNLSSADKAKIEAVAALVGAQPKKGDNREIQEGIRAGLNYMGIGDAYFEDYLSPEQIVALIARENEFKGRWYAEFYEMEGKK